MEEMDKQNVQPAQQESTQTEQVTAPQPAATPLSPEQQAYERQKEERRMRRLAQKRRRQMQQRIVLALLALILVLAVVLAVRSCTSRDASPQQPAEPAETPSVSGTDEQPAVTVEPDTVITLGAVGDIMVYDDQIELAKQADGSYDFTQSFAAVSALTMSADLMVGNLELTFCGEPYSGKPDFRAPEATGEALAAAGFDLVQTANTYSITNGISGLNSTIKYLNTMGIDHVGTYAAADDKSTNEGVFLKNVNGIKIAFIAYTKGVNNLHLPEGSEYAVDLLYTDYDSEYTRIDRDALEDSLKAARALNPDLTVAMLHWGSEWDDTITDTQETITDLLLDGGVDIILGSHPHVVGKMEQREVTTDDGKTKTCFIAYSLGNFIASPAAQTSSHTMESVLLELEITRKGSTGETTITGVSYTPLYIAQTAGDAGNAIQVLPIRSAIKSGLFPELEEKMTDAIANLRTATASDYDSGR